MPALKQLLKDVPNIEFGAEGGDLAPSRLKPSRIGSALHIRNMTSVMFLAKCSFQVPPTYPSLTIFSSIVAKAYQTLSLVLRGGLEPPRPCGHRLLRPACLPVPPPQPEFQKASLQDNQSVGRTSSRPAIISVAIWSAVPPTQNHFAPFQSRNQKPAPEARGPEPPEGFQRPSQQPQPLREFRFSKPVPFLFWE